MMLFEVVDPVGGDRQLCAVAAVQEFLLREIPDGELEVFARRARQGFKIGERHARTRWFSSPLRAQDLEHRDANELLELVVVFDLGRGSRETPALLFPLGIRARSWQPCA